MDTMDLYQGAVAIYAARVAQGGTPGDVRACVAEAAALWREAHRQAPALVRQVVAETVARVTAWAPVADEDAADVADGAPRAAVVVPEVDFLALDREG